MGAAPRPKVLGDAVLHGTPLLHPLEAAAGQGQRHEQEVDVRVFTHGAAAHRAVDRQRDETGTILLARGVEHGREYRLVAFMEGHGATPPTCSAVQGGDSAAGRNVTPFDGSVSMQY